MNADAEIRAFFDQSWWEYEAKRNGQPWPPSKGRLERGPGSWVAAPATARARDYLSEPLGGAIDYLNLPLDVLRRRF